MNMRTPPGDRVTGSIPVVSSRTWHSARTAEHTLNAELTYAGDFGVQLWTGDVDDLVDGPRVLLDRTQIDELITDLVERRALLATRRATGRTP